MGPIRAFSRPSLAAGEFVTSASPYSHTPGFSAARRPCCTHSSSSLGPQHSALPHPHLFCSVCAGDPLHAGLVSSPAAPPPCLFHFKKLLPPGAAPPDTHLAVPAQQDTGGASQGVTRDAVGHETRKKDIYEHGWNNSGEYEWKNKDERKLKKKSSENVWKKHKEESKWKQHNGAHKRNANNSEFQWERFGDPDLWKRNEDESKRKNRKGKLKWNKPHREHQGVRSEEENESGDERRKAKWSKNKPAPAAVSSPVSKADDPCTSRMSLGFPFSDDDDDDDHGHEGKGKKETNEESWRISDIVETEDEEGENQLGHVQDTSGEDCDPKCSLPAIVYSALGDGESVDVVQQQQLPSAAGNGSSIPTQNGKPESESEWQDSPPTGENGELHKESDVDEENEPEEQMEHENEGKRKPGEVECPRNGVRATQRLRPRTYR